MFDERFIVAELTSALLAEHPFQASGKFPEHFQLTAIHPVIVLIGVKYPYRRSLYVFHKKIRFRPHCLHAGDDSAERRGVFVFKNPYLRAENVGSHLHPTLHPGKSAVGENAAYR